MGATEGRESRRWSYQCYQKIHPLQYTEMWIPNQRIWLAPYIVPHTKKEYQWNSNKSKETYLTSITRHHMKDPSELTEIYNLDSLMGISSRRICRDIKYIESIRQRLSTYLPHGSITEITWQSRSMGERTVRWLINIEKNTNFWGEKNILDSKGKYLT